MKKIFKVLSSISLLQQSAEPVWLINKLWSHLGVGIIAGAPKSCKSWLALDMAISVASGTPCMKIFPIASAGRVLLYMAEDSLSTLHQRLYSLSCCKSLNFKNLNIGILNPDSLRLDHLEDQQCLANTIEKEKPVLIILDPFIRMHGIDENSSGEVSKILGYLRNLQRQYKTAICIVHHARKNGGSVYQPGVGIRGSSDFHAWGDTNLYLKRKEDHLILIREQRAAPAMEPLSVKLVIIPDNMPHLEVIGDFHPVSQKSTGIEEKIVDYLKQESVPVPQKILREYLKIRNQSLTEALKKLNSQKKICRSEKGWSISSSITDSSTEKTVPVPTLNKKWERNSTEQLDLPFTLNNFVQNNKTCIGG
ncbi:MAG: AAA family ATPase [Nitrospinota bacterium]